MYALSGTIVERASGMSWEAFVRSRIFGPLGMNETEALVSTIGGKPNVAVPHCAINDSIRVVPMRSTDAIAPAGSVWSSVSRHVEVDAIRARQRPRRIQAARSKPEHFAS